MPYTADFSNFPTVERWTTPAKMSTPDYLNACATASSGMQAPNSTFGYQPPNSGNAYTGIIAWQAFNSNGAFTYDYREYLQTKLLQPLHAGKRYCVSFLVSPTISAAFNFNYVATDEIGINFSTTRKTDTLNYTISLPYHVKNATGNYLTDTSKWYKISGTYLANGGEEWLTLGCFNNTGNAPSFINLYPLTPIQNLLYWSYLFIEDVSVREITSADTIKNVRDTLVCTTSGLNIPLQASVDAGSYLWNTGASSKQLTANDTGIYWCASTIECGFVVDTIHIRYQPYRKLSLGKDTVNCLGQPIEIASNHIFNSYLWNTGASGGSLTANQSGTYVLTVEDFCGTQSDTINVTIQSPTPVPAMNDTSICQYVLNPKIHTNGQPILWYPGANAPMGWHIQPEINTKLVGVQVLYVSQKVGKCESPKVPVNIDIRYTPRLELDKYIRICMNTDTLIGKPYPNVQYLWNTGENVCCIQPREQGTYQLAISNDCGVETDTAFVELSSCGDCLVVPNAFTPNNDGRNDCFTPVLKCPVLGYKMEIFNRWGEAVFSTGDLGVGWHGRNKTVNADAGVYIYTIEYRSQNTGEKKLLQGNVMLIR